MDPRPADAGATVYVLTVRGKLSPATLEEGRDLHNRTAGAAENIAAARSLGDLTHTVYVPRGGSGTEVLFIDTWNSVSGIGDFFGNPQVTEMAGQLFTDRDPVVWAPTEGFGDFHLPVPSGREVAALGILRAPVTSVEAAQKAFGTHTARVINKARKHGQISHQTFLRLNAPGEPQSLEVLGVDAWFDIEGMDSFYADESNYADLAGAFAGAPDSATWRPAPGEWNEW
jgi:hypothetical protein